MMNVSKKVCESAKALCVIDGKPIGEVEKELGLSKGYISRQIRGTDTMPLKIAYEIATYFGYTLTDLIEKDFTSWAENSKLDREIDELEESIKEQKKAIEEIRRRKKELANDGN